MQNKLKFHGGRNLSPLYAAVIIALAGASAAGAADTAYITSSKDGVMTFPNVRVVNSPQVAPERAPAAATAGFKAYIDANGALRGPTADELLQESQASLQAATLQAQTALPAMEFVTVGGAVGMKLDESQMLFSVVQKDENGELNEFCVTGPEAAAQLMAVKAPASGALRKKESVK